MKYRIANLETGEVYFTDDQADAIAKSYQSDIFDVEILGA
jgi:hypothetical protein